MIEPSHLGADEFAQIVRNKVAIPVQNENKINVYKKENNLWGDR